MSPTTLRYRYSNTLYDPALTAKTFGLSDSSANLSDGVNASTSAGTFPGIVYSFLGAEAGNMSEWSAQGSDAANQVPSGSGIGSPIARTSTNRSKTGTRSFLLENTDPTNGAEDDGNLYVDMLSYGPNLVGMGGPGGRYMTGFYSWWMYIDAGFTGEDYTMWREIATWFTAGSVISPIFNLGLHGGNPTTGGTTVQLRCLLKNAAQGCYTAPNITGYSNNNGYYWQTSGSPQGIKAFPLGQWVHVEVYYKAAASNGQVIVYQDGLEVMNLTAPTFDTLKANATCTYGDGDMLWCLRIYSGTRSVVQRVYYDDVRVTSQRIYPYLP